MRRRGADSQETLGHDSFLDVVANLVGILIILVVVVGTQAGQQMSQTDETLTAKTKEVEQKREELKQRRQSSEALDRDNAEMNARLQQETALAEMAAIERDQMQRFVVLAEQKVAERLAAVDQTRAAETLRSSEVMTLTQELEALRQEKLHLEATPQETLQLDHHATPLARTVFNEEIHFRVKDGRIVPVPLDDLVELMTDQFQFQVEKLNTVNEITETVGPVGDFRLQFLIRNEEQSMRTELGTIRRTVPQFIGFILLPTRPILGEDLRTAIADPNSVMRRQLATADAANTTVTVWVYPDSYDVYLELEAWLHEQGFLVAGWPLPANQPIAGGPNGMRSVAQ